MANIHRSRRTETAVYVALWLIAAALWMLDVMRARAQMAEPLLTLGVLARGARMLLPFLALFLLNNCVLIPRLLMRNRVVPYFLATAAAVVVLWTWQYFNFMSMVQCMPPGSGLHPEPHVRPLVPLPLFLDFIYALLVVGCNLSITLMFQRFDDKLERESLMKANAENQLAYLKGQINPHFYMNMLNNIHGMIEIDPEKAQRMVIDLSQLMRYMLYDVQKPAIGLGEEVAFVRNYLNIMRQRYPEDRVNITGVFPTDSQMAGISVAPLMFLAFIENAFKHGVSYREPSSVAVEIATDANTVRFSCVNSRHPGMTRATDAEHSGIGLRNLRQRMQLLYGDRATLRLHETETTYTATLTIPIHHDTAHAENHHN